MNMKWLFNFLSLILLWYSCTTNHSSDVKIVYFEDQKTIMQRIEKDDTLKHGKFEEFYKNGQLKAIQYFVHDTLHDTTKIFHPSGQLKTMQVYQMGKRTGCWKEFSKDGQLISEINFKDDFLDGVSKEFTYRTGKLLTLVEYTEGQKNGMEEKYYANGQLMSRCVFDKGRPVPGIEEFTEQGKPIINNIEITTEIKNEMLLAERITYYFKCQTDLSHVRAYECLPVTAGKGIDGFRKLASNEKGFVYEVTVKNGSHVMSDLNIAFMADSKLGNTFIKVIVIPIAYENL